MPSLAEIVSSVYGAFRLFLFDHRGYENFNFSREGFWRSFFVAILLAPFYLAIVALQHRHALAVATPAQLARLPALSTTLIAESLAYPVYWVSFPLVMLVLTHMLDVRGRFVPYVVVYNWSGIVAVGIEFLPYLAFGLGILPGRLIAPCLYASLVIAMIYRWSITRTVLGVSSAAAVGVVFVDVLLTFAIALTTQALLMGGAAQ